MFYDVHAHIFNNADVPDGYLGFRLSNTEKILKVSSKIFSSITSGTTSFLDRISSFEGHLLMNRGENYLSHIASLPEDSCICLLTLDMSTVKGGGQIDYGFQLDLALSLRRIYGRDKVKVFANILTINHNYHFLINCLENNEFDGVKIYPPLSSIMDDKLFQICSNNGIPITAHCGHYGFTKTVWNISDTKQGDPEIWHPVLAKYPNLKINLAHFGGGSEEYEKTILDLMRKYPNVYTDTAFSCGKDKRMEPYRKALLNEPDFKNRLLFGTDFYMVHLIDIYGYIERCRRYLGEEAWKLATEINPAKFLQIGEGSLG